MYITLKEFLLSLSDEQIISLKIVSGGDIKTNIELTQIISNDGSFWIGGGGTYVIYCDYDYSLDTWLVISSSEWYNDTMEFEEFETIIDTCIRNTKIDNFLS